jgi:hypothetical protein
VGLLVTRRMSESNGLTHALMNHLAIILGFSELLLQDLAPDDPRRSDLEEIHRAAAAAVRAIADGGSGGPG